MAFSSRSVSAFFEQPPKTALLPRDPEQILNLLARTRARNLGLEERASHDLVALEPTRSRKALEASHVLLGEPHSESMLEISHTKIINIAIALSKKNVAPHARISRRR
jgi:hypothetical protein